MLLEFKFENVLDLIDTLSPVPPVLPTSILTTVASFSNPEAIVNIEDVTVPYPSDIVVSGLPGSISNVTVTIHNFVDPGTINSPNPGHLSLLVVSPGGTAVLIYSDADDSTGAFGPVTFTLDDNAATLIPQSDFVSGIYKPSVYKNDFNLNLNSPAPTGSPYNTALSSFIGQAPNGTWSLYSFDRHGGHGMTIEGGWTLTIATVGP